MAIPGIGSATSITPLEFPTLDKSSNAGGAGSSTGAGFGDKIAESLNDLQQAHTKSDDLALQAASGSLTDVHDYMIAANQAELATQLTVAVRNKAVESFNQIMNMQV